MRIRVGNGLVWLNLLAVILILSIAFFPVRALTIILGTPFVIFFPGYVLILALFPEKERMGNLERFALSFGASLAVVPVLGVILYAIPWGIKLESILTAMVSFLLVTSLVAWLRWRRVPVQERFSFELALIPEGSHGTWDKVLSVSLAVVVLGAFSTIGYVMVNPKQGTKFSEFYTLGLEGEAVHHPLELKVGQKAQMTLGIINQERETVSYRIEVTIDGDKASELGPMVLADKERWEGEITFTPKKAGTNQKIAFLLYKNGESQPRTEPLRWWANVT